MKNLIKSITLLALMLTMTLGVSAQSKTGLSLTATVSSNNVERDQTMLGHVGAEAGYTGKIFGAFVSYGQLVNHPSDASYIGLKLQGKLLQYEGLNLFLTMEGDRHINTIDKKVTNDYQWVPGAKISATIYKKLYANLEYKKTIYEQLRRGKPMWKERDGGMLGIGISF